MRVEETDHAEPRDQIESPTYRVNFWEQPRPGYGWNLEAFVLTDAEDVTEVLRWVEKHAAGRRFEVFAETDAELLRSFGIPRRTGLLRLLGDNSDDGETADIIRLEKL